MELLLGFLDNPKYDLRPVLKCVEESIEPMRKDLNATSRKTSRD